MFGLFLRALYKKEIAFSIDSDTLLVIEIDDDSDLINLLAELCVLMLTSSLTLTTSIDIRSAS